MTPHAASRLLIFLPLFCACAGKPKPVAVPPELNAIVVWLQAHPTSNKVLTLTDTGAAAVEKAGLQPLHDPSGQAALLAHDVTALQQLMTQDHLDYLLTTEPDFSDAPELPKDRAVILPSTLEHIVKLYGTGTRERPCVDHLALVAASTTVRNVGGRHLPAAMLLQRVPGARLVAHKLVPGIPVRVETTRVFAGQKFVFDCQNRADAQGNLDMPFPYATLPDLPVRMWTAMTKSGDVIKVTPEAVEKGLVVDLTQ